jgi:VanZ family protein
MIELLERGRKFSIIFAIIVALEIFLVSSIPGSTISSKLDFSIAYHLISFFLFNLFILILVANKGKIIAKKLILILFISLTYAALDELHQFFVPLRTPGITDFLLDCSGIFLSTFIYKYYWQRKLSDKA